MPELNEVLIKRVLDHIRANPTAYDQNEILQVTERNSCGSIGCFGGWAYLMAFPKEEWSEVAARGWRDPGGRQVLEVAGDVLGLSDGEAGYLFDGVDATRPEDQLAIVEKRLDYIRQRRTGKINCFPEDLDEEQEEL
jgi:hypothetical protein